MKEYSVIRDAIKNLGAVLVEEHLQPEIFGSAYCIFEGLNGARFRLVWDGKEGYGFLQSAKSTNQWEDVGPYVFDASNVQSSKLVALLSVAQSFVYGSTSV
jgi:hypothetical protein